MKKIILLAVLAFGAVTANAQQREKGAIEISPQIGLSLSDYYGKDVGSDSHTPISSIAIGFGADYFLNNRWSLHSGMFSQTMGADLDLIQELHYLTIPLNASWHFGSTRRWNLNFGPSIGILTSAKYGGIDNKNEFHSTQLGLNLGIGYKIKVTEKFSLLVDYQAMSGLTNATKEYTIKNSYGSLNVGGVIKL